MPSFDDVSDVGSDMFEWPDVSSALKAIEYGEVDEDDILVSKALSRPPLNHKHNGIKRDACGKPKKAAKKVSKKKLKSSPTGKPKKAAKKVAMKKLACGKPKAAKAKAPETKKGKEVAQRCLRMS